MIVTRDCNGGGGLLVAPSPLGLRHLSDWLE